MKQKERYSAESGRFYPDFFHAGRLAKAGFGEKSG
jgi:hypothetical protein